MADRLLNIECSLPAQLGTAVQGALDEWGAEDKVRRLWARDTSLWTGGDEDRWLDWLQAADDSRRDGEALRELGDEVRAEGFTHAMVLGMGGSSLFPEVLRMTFGVLPGYPDLRILDSTDPAQVLAAERSVDLARTVFIVSSKSGTTLEPNIFKQYFFERARRVLGAENAGRHFVAVTDPGSKLEKEAREDGFRHVYHGVPGVGGRYSALTAFGVIPGTVMGLDMTAFRERAGEMVRRCGPDVPPDENSGVVLGAVLGVLGASGRNKVTVIASPGILDFGAWLEQLLAESTGKDEKALIPVDRERIGPPAVYGEDRLFVYLRLEPAPDADQDAAVSALQAAGQPVVVITVPEPLDLAQEVFRWEFATAVAGSIMRLHPFNQPDVEASKIATRELTTAYEQTGALPAEAPFLEGDGLRFFARREYADRLAATGHTPQTVLKAHLDTLRPGDYFALLAYVAMDAAHEDALQALRHLVRDETKVATCLGFGPRFLHSTGQAYKGGPRTGVFLQVTCDDAADVPVPGQRYTFGIVKSAQARGDFAVLEERGQRALRVHLGADVAGGLAALYSAVRAALGLTS